MCRQATMRFWSGEMSTLWREPSSKKHLDVPCAESKSIQNKCCTWKTFDIVCHPQRPWLHRNSQNKASQTLWMVCNVVWREDVLSMWFPNLPRRHLIAVTAWEVHLQVPKATHRNPATPCHIQHIRVCTILQVFASCHHTALSGSIYINSSAPLLPRSVPITESKHAEAAVRLSHMMHLAKFRSRLYQRCQTNSRGIRMSCCVIFVTNIVFVCHGTISHEPSSCTRNTCAPELASVPAVHWNPHTCSETTLRILLWNASHVHKTIP